tara:strand:- start:1028 stop:1222 length:195 start_codon:yes stop_codon:yes gene_type:complete
MIPIDYTKIRSVEVEGIDPSDYPDFCDAYIGYAEIDGREATDEELEELSEDRDFVYEMTFNQLF